MAKKRRHRRSVTLPEFEALGTLVVKPTEGRDDLEDLLEAQSAFGGTLRARLVPERVDGRAALAVVILYTSNRTRIGYLDDSLARPLMSKVRRLWLFRRAVTCNATVDSHRHSPTYLDVTLNPPVQSPVRGLGSLT